MPWWRVRSCFSLTVDALKGSRQCSAHDKADGVGIAMADCCFIFWILKPMSNFKITVWANQDRLMRRCVSSLLMLLCAQAFPTFVKCGLFAAPVGCCKICQLTLCPGFSNVYQQRTGCSFCQFAKNGRSFVGKPTTGRPSLWHQNWEM